MTTTTPTSTPIAANPAAVAVAPARTLGILSLVLGLASLAFGLIFLVPIAAIVLGILALRSEPASKGMAIAGVVIGAVQLVWLFVTGALLLAALPIFAILGSVGAFGWN
jgi:hypothetical protein